MEIAEQITSRRERRRFETRAKLLAAALELITTKGYVATSIDDIARLADVARGTALNYFPLKEDYLSAIVVERQEAFRQTLTRVAEAAPSALQGIIQASMAQARSYENEEQTSRPLVREWLRAGGPMLSGADDSIAALSAVITLAKDRGEVASDVNPTDASTLLLDAYLGALVRWAGNADIHSSLRRPLGRTLKLLMRSISPSQNEE